MKASKGIRRLAVLLGSIGSMAWIAFVRAVSKGFAEVEAPWDGSSWLYLLVYFFLSRSCLSTVLHGSFGVSDKIHSVVRLSQNA
jgi:hypothetical protein